VGVHVVVLSFCSDISQNKLTSIHETTLLGLGALDSLYEFICYLACMLSSYVQPRYCTNNIISMIGNNSFSNLGSLQLLCAESVSCLNRTSIDPHTLIPSYPPALPSLPLLIFSENRRRRLLHTNEITRIWANTFTGLIELRRLYHHCIR
jgi:hypothetical protein